MNMRRRLMAVDERNDVRVIKTLENVYFRRKVFPQLLVKLRQIDRFDGNVGARFLEVGIHQYSPTALSDPAGSTETHRMYTLVNRGKASSTNFIEASVTTNRHLGLVRLSRPSRMMCRCHDCNTTPSISRKVTNYRQHPVNHTTT